MELIGKCEVCNEPNRRGEMGQIIVHEHINPLSPETILEKIEKINRAYMESSKIAKIREPK